MATSVSIGTLAYEEINFFACGDEDLSGWTKDKLKRFVLSSTTAGVLTYDIIEHAALCLILIRD